MPPPLPPETSKHVFSRSRGAGVVGVPPKNRRESGELVSFCGPSTKHVRLLHFAVENRNPDRGPMPASPCDDAAPPPQSGGCLHLVAGAKLTLYNRLC
jgi:hypothetical protein